MKFLVDAQLPRSLARLLGQLGHEATHTLELPRENRTPDSELCLIARDEMRVLITKDEDFVDSFLLAGQPPTLLLVATGNISNQELLALFEAHLSEIVSALENHAFVEIDRDGLTKHG